MDAATTTPQAGLAARLGEPDLIDIAIVATGGARIALGVTALTAPRLVSRGFGIGDDIEAARYLGARDLVAGLGIVLRHRHGRARGWLEAAAMVDTADTVITLLAAARGRISTKRAVGVALLAASSAASAGLLARLAPTTAN